MGADQLSLSKIEAALDDFGGWSEWMRHESQDVPGIGQVKCLEAYFGEEFINTLYVVLELPDGRVVRKDGYNVSHDGWYWDGDLYEVRQVEKVVKVWETI